MGLSGKSDKNDLMFREIYDKYFPELYLCLHSVTDDSWEIEDVIQDTFLKILRGGVDLSSISNIRGYIWFCARNALYNRLRDKARRKRLISEVFADAALQTDETDVADADDLFRRVSEAVRDLPEGCGRIFRMVKYEHKSYMETARALGLSVKTVESQMGIALRKIRERVRKK